MPCPIRKVSWPAQAHLARYRTELARQATQTLPVFSKIRVMLQARMSWQCISTASKFQVQRKQRGAITTRLASAESWLAPLVLDRYIARTVFNFVAGAAIAPVAVLEITPSGKSPSEVFRRLFCWRSSKASATGEPEFKQVEFCQRSVGYPFCTQASNPSAITLRFR